jgi:hypothetical protein
MYGAVGVTPLTCTVCVDDVFVKVTCSGGLVPSTRCLSSSPSPFGLKSATMTGPLVCVMIVESAAVTGEEPPPETVTKFTSGEID